MRRDLIFLFVVALTATSLARNSNSPSLKHDYSYADKLSQLESTLKSNDVYVREGTSFFAMTQFKRTAPRAREVAEKARKMLQAVHAMADDRTLEQKDRAGNIGSLNETCLTAPTCLSSKYRTYDGTCNSLSSPLLGSSFTTFRRLAAPKYSDGIEEPRIATNGDDLTSARKISTTLFGSADKPMTNTLAFMQFGQFINHDMESSTTYDLGNGTGIMCCDAKGNFLPASLMHPECDPIEIPADDSFYKSIGVSRTCMNFVTTVAGVRLDCSLGYADQLNQNTHWLDASTVYGSDEDQTDTLRAWTGGLLLMSTDSFGRKMLPVSANCTTNACYMAGDARATEQPQLAVMHTLWAREHNRIARQLASLNPKWSDEILFQEARRILVAEMQHITYAEWLPLLLNSTYLSNYGLLSSAPGYFSGYGANLKSGPVSNEFATAAFRMGHSMVRGLIQLFDQNGNLSSTFDLSSTFFDASAVAKSKAFFDSAVRGLLVEMISAVDSQITQELGNKLFRGNLSYGFDLVALNIQRGRNHGLPGYNAYRQLCGMSKLTSFSQLSGNGVADATISQLSKMYASVDDIDLFVGGLIELADAGDKLGPTFSCMIAENFSQLKKSDRFYYELGGQRHSFNSTQLTEIRKASMARIFCDNNDGTVTQIQPKAFLPASGTNAAVVCNSPSIPAVNLAMWKNEKL